MPPTRRLEEQGEDRVGLRPGHHWPCGLDQLEVILGRRPERRLQGLLQLDADANEDLTDEVLLGREVVDDDPVADPELLGDSAVGELAQPVVERDGQGTAQNLFLGVPVAHHHLIVVITANSVLQ